MNPSRLVPEDFLGADITELQTALNSLSDSGKKWQIIEVTGEYNLLTESALLNAIEQLGKEAVIGLLTGGN